MLPVTIRRNSRAKRMILRLNPNGQEIVLTLPKRVSERAGMAFVERQKEWLEKQIAQQQAPIIIAPNLTVPLFGEDCILEHRPEQRGVKVLRGSENYEETADVESETTHKNRLLIGGDLDRFANRFERWVRKEAKQYFGEMAVELASELAVSPASVSVRDTKTRWGSCSRDRRINLNWRLVFAPEDVARYVVAHEVAHLVHFDHSPKFWSLVENLQADYKQQKTWLRLHGQTLHRYQLEAAAVKEASE